MCSKQMNRTEASGILYHTNAQSRFENANNANSQTPSQVKSTSANKDSYINKSTLLAYLLFVSAIF